MSNTGETSVAALAKGQLWRLNQGFVYVVEPGERVVRYRLLKSPDQRSAATRLLAIRKMESWLKEQSAELVNVADTKSGGPDALQPGAGIGKAGEPARAGAHDRRFQHRSLSPLHLWSLILNRLYGFRRA
jgi:hypothetical protein